MYVNMTIGEGCCEKLKHRTEKGNLLRLAQVQSCGEVSGPALSQNSLESHSEQGHGGAGIFGLGGQYLRASVQPIYYT